MRNITVLIVVVSTANLGGQGQTRPKLPFVDRTCPFQDCRSRTWSVVAETRLFTSLGRDAGVTATLQPGMTVRGVSGLVVTTRLGRAVVTESMVTGRGPVTFKVRPGDPVFVLHYAAEGGEFTFWLRGVTDTAFIPDQDSCRRNPAIASECAIQMVELPECVWWVQVRSQDGRDGWTRQLDHFVLRSEVR